MVTLDYLLYLLIICNVVNTMHSSKDMEGYPSGFLPDCPGSDKPAIIKKKTLKYLTITVQDTGDVMTARRTKYNYYQMKELAKDPAMDFKKRTMMYVGGYLDSPKLPFALLLAAQYKSLGYNVLLLDTNKFTVMEYPLAARFSRAVGKHVAEMLTNLTKEGLNPKKFEMVGLSLGGQTISFIAKSFQAQTGLNISRLTALDPSGPCFRNLGPENRLDQSDADFVEVIDTNIDGYGMAAPIGHINYYVNGGEFQPGDIMWIPCTVICSHIRSYTLWLAALQYPDSFIAVRCNSVQEARDKACFSGQPRDTNILGLKVDKRKQGIFFLATHNTYPYFLGREGLSKENDIIQAALVNINKESVIKI